MDAVRKGGMMSEDLEFRPRHINTHPHTFTRNYFDLFLNNLFIIVYFVFCAFDKNKTNNNNYYLNIIFSSFTIIILFKRITNKLTDRQLWWPGTDLFGSGKQDAVGDQIWTKRTLLICVLLFAFLIYGFCFKAEILGFRVSENWGNFWLSKYDGYTQVQW